MSVTAGSWLMASVCMERMRQNLSAIFWVYGSRSEIHAPASPHCLPPTSGCMTLNAFWLAVMPVTRCPPRTSSGSAFPWSFWSDGLPSNRSTCDGPPDWNR